jgi:hypothetical protein
MAWMGGVCNSGWAQFVRFVEGRIVKLPDNYRGEGYRAKMAGKLEGDNPYTSGLLGGTEGENKQAHKYWLEGYRRPVYKRI